MGRAAGLRVFFYECHIRLFRTRPALVGAIWRVQDNIAVDFGLRGALVNDQPMGEIRAGVTFVFGVTKRPDIRPPCDMYEYTYHMDSGAKAGDYVDAFMQAIR